MAIEIESLAAAWVGNGEIPSLLICKPLHSRNRSKAIGGHLIQKLKSSNAKAAENFN